MCPPKPLMCQPVRARGMIGRKADWRGPCTGHSSKDKKAIHGSRASGWAQAQRVPNRSIAAGPALPSPSSLRTIAFFVADPSEMATALSRELKKPTRQIGASHEASCPMCGSATQGCAAGSSLLRKQQFSHALSALKLGLANFSAGGIMREGEAPRPKPDAQSAEQAASGKPTAPPKWPGMPAKRATMCASHSAKAAAMSWAAAPVMGKPSYGLGKRRGRERICPWEAGHQGDASASERARRWMLARRWASEDPRFASRARVLSASGRWAFVIRF
jgi:hypothetical protein